VALALARSVRLALARFRPVDRTFSLCALALASLLSPCLALQVVDDYALIWRFKALSRFGAYGATMLSCRITCDSDAHAG